MENWKIAYEMRQIRLQSIRNRGKIKKKPLYFDPLPPTSLVDVLANQSALAICYTT